MDKMKAKRIAVFIGLKIAEIVGVPIGIALVVGLIVGIVAIIGNLLDWIARYHPWHFAWIIPLVVIFYAYVLFKDFWKPKLKWWVDKNWEWSGKIVGDVSPEDKKNTSTTE